MPAITGTKPLKPLHSGMGLYQVFYWPNKAPQKSKPWAVANLETGDVNGRWHATKEEALAQARALYATLGAKARVHGEETYMHNAFFLFADAGTLVAEDGVKWVEAIAPKTYFTPGYGEVPVTSEKIDNFIFGINTNIRGQDIAIDYEHGLDPSKGKKAAGWIKGARKNAMGNLELAVDFTEPAKQEIINKEWRYFSLEWDDAWEHPDGVIYKDVVMGGGLTNRPVAKGLMPINFSEIFMEREGEVQFSEIITLVDETGEYQLSVWTGAYVNTLPDSSFGYIEPGGTKDGSGKTVPRSLRHLEFKDANGKIDLPHVRNALSRLGQAATGASWKGFNDSKRNSLISKFRRMLGASMSELQEIEAQLFSEEGALERSDPGITAPVYDGTTQPDPGTGHFVPRDTGDPSADPAIADGWRRDTPPIALSEDGRPVEIRFSESEAIGYLTSAKVGLDRIHTNAADALIERIDRVLATDFRVRSFNELQALVTETRTMLRGEHSLSDPSKGGTTVGELTQKDLLELRTVLGVEDDGRILEAVKVKFGELSALRDAVSATEQERVFAEQYPQYYEEHRRLMERDRRNTAKTFSESVQTIRKAEGFGLKSTKQGLSVACREKVEEVHMKFGEGKATLEDFEEVVKSIVNGGIVEFGEIGSSGEEDVPVIDSTSAPGVANARRVFAEQVAKVLRENPEMAADPGGYMLAVNEVARKHPDLAETYRVTLPA